jgi:hypothetical protein
MELSATRQLTSCAATREPSSILWNQKVLYRNRESSRNEESVRRLFVPPWRWRRHVPPKRRFIKTHTALHHRTLHSPISDLLIFSGIVFDSVTETSPIFPYTHLVWSPKYLNYPNNTWNFSLYSTKNYTVPPLQRQKQSPFFFFQFA